MVIIFKHRSYKRKETEMYDGGCGDRLSAKSCQCNLLEFPRNLCSSIEKPILVYVSAGKFEFATQRDVSTLKTANFRKQVFNLICTDYYIVNRGILWGKPVTPRCNEAVDLSP